jgi:hypothetical protein
VRLSVIADGSGFALAGLGRPPDFPMGFGLRACHPISHAEP